MLTVVPVVLTLGLAALGELSFGFSRDSSSDTLTALDSGAVGVVSNPGAFFELFATVVLNGMLVHVVAEAVLGRPRGERIGVFAALRRAGRLSRGQFRRILGILVP